MDAEGEIALPVVGGKHLKEDFVGSHFPAYDFTVILSHFKGHAMGGFGGALKNMSIGIASADKRGLQEVAAARLSGAAVFLAGPIPIPEFATHIPVSAPRLQIFLSKAAMQMPFSPSSTAFSNMLCAEIPRSMST